MGSGFVAAAPSSGPSFRLRKGLDVEVGGCPAQVIEPARPVSSVAVLPPDHVGLWPRLLVEQGQRVVLGQPLVAGRDRPGLVLGAPGGGRVAEIERGPRRALRAVVIQLDGDEDEQSFEATPRGRLQALHTDEVVQRLLAAGLWPALRARPFGGPADPATAPRALFVTALDTDPLAARPEVVLAGNEAAFEDGLTVLGRLLDGPLYLCMAAESNLPTGDRRVSVARFEGPHPAGLPGTHIHLLEPVSRDRTVWHVGYQDVVAIGRLFTTGRITVERVVSLAGPRVRRPRLLRTRVGANLDELLVDELAHGTGRVVSGSVLSGRRASGWGRHLGRFHEQVCALIEGDPGGLSPLGRFLPGRFRADGTSLHGHPGPFLPLEAFERVVPLDLLPAPLLRALLVGDVETAEKLGCLELTEEDLALCTYVCPGKLDYGAHLRKMLDELARRG